MLFTASPSGLRTDDEQVPEGCPSIDACRSPSASTRSRAFLAADMLLLLSLFEQYQFPATDVNHRFSAFLRALTPLGLAPETFHGARSSNLHRYSQPHGGRPMSDDKSKRGSPDRDRIDINDPDEVRNWTKSLGVTKEELQRAVEAVGTTAGKVYDYLGRQRSR